MALHRWGQWHYVDRDGGSHPYRSIAGRVQRQSLQGWSPQAVPAIAAWIYAEGRMRLWDAQLVAGRAEVCYCHTDSLFTSALGFRRLNESGMVGNRVPGKQTLKGVHDWMDIQGISYYDTPSRRVRSGVAQSGLVDTGEAAGAEYMETVAQALGQSRPPQPIVRAAPAQRVRRYLHGVPNSDGSVSAWRMG